MQFTNKQLHDEMERWTRDNHVRIEVEPKQGLFNHKCMCNAVEWQSKNGGTVHEVIAIGPDGPILHYINNSNGIYFETTLGFMARDLEYFLVRGVSTVEYSNIQEVFRKRLKALDSRYLRWYHKLFGIRRIL